MLAAVGFSATAVGGAHATCSDAEQQAAQAALAKFDAGAPKLRRAYFKRHKEPAQRKAYDKRQAALRARLAAAATCTVTTPPPATTSPPAESCAPTLSPGSNSTNGPGPLRNAGVQPQGALKAAMLFVDFPDASATETAQSVYDLIGPGAENYYGQQSYGRMSLRITPILKWYRMSKPSGDYGFGRGGLTFVQQLAYMQEAVNLADADVDFSDYQLVYVVSTKNATAINYSPAFDPNRDAAAALKADGNKIFGGATIGNDIYASARWAWHVLAHETGHAFGMPDYYDIPGFDPRNYQQQFHYAGGWSIMSWVEPAAEFFAWDKYREGWIDPTQIRCQDTAGSTTQTVTPVEVAGGVKMIVAKTGPSTADVVEVRALTGGDSQMCKAGVLVYSLDATKPSGQGPLQVQTAHPGSDAAQIAKCAILYDAPLQAGESWEDTAVRVEVLAANADGSYSVRMTRK